MGLQDALKRLRRAMIRVTRTHPVAVMLDLGHDNPRGPLLRGSSESPDRSEATRTERAVHPFPHGRRTVLQIAMEEDTDLVLATNLQLLLGNNSLLLLRATITGAILDTILRRRTVHLLLRLLRLLGSALSCNSTAVVRHHLRLIPRRLRLPLRTILHRLLPASSHLHRRHLRDCALARLEERLVGHGHSRAEYT